MEKYRDSFMKKIIYLIAGIYCLQGYAADKPKLDHEKLEEDYLKVILLQAKLAHEEDEGEPIRTVKKAAMRINHQQLQTDWQQVKAVAQRYKQSGYIEFKDELQCFIPAIEQWRTIAQAQPASIASAADDTALSALTAEVVQAWEGLGDQLTQKKINQLYQERGEDFLRQSILFARALKSFERKKEIKGTQEQQDRIQLPPRPSSTPKRRPNAKDMVMARLPYVDNQ